MCASAIPHMLVASRNERKFLDICYCWLRFEKSEQVPFWFVFGLLLCFWSGKHVAHLYANTNTQLC